MFKLPILRARVRLGIDKTGILWYNCINDNVNGGTLMTEQFYSFILHKEHHAYRREIAEDFAAAGVSPAARLLGMITP